MVTIILTVFLSAALSILAGVPAHGDQKRQGPDDGLGPGITEKLGETLPLDLTLTDDRGRPVVLRDLITKPTILNFVYYRCSHTCPALLSGLSDVLSRVDMAPGGDFSVLTISFDETDTPDLAAQKKTDYQKAAGREFPDGSWNFLTADKETIMKITGAAGFGFKRAPNGFAHPVALIVVSPKGKITRYLYGIKFLPMDLTLAITEASKGLAVPTVNKVLLYCYSYDPEGRRYVFNILKITAAATIFFIILFIGWLTLSGRKQRSPGK
ncbi:MAG: SCO family protein [Thermodesulfovibrionales bacterium]